VKKTRARFNSVGTNPHPGPLPFRQREREKVLPCAFALENGAFIPQLDSILPLLGGEGRGEVKRSLSLNWSRFVPLRYRADARALGFLALLGALYVVQWTGLVRHWLLLVLTCILSFVAFIIRHNHIHCRTFSNRHWNSAFEYLLVACTGQAAAGIIAIHNERHHDQYHSDEDCVRSSLVNFRWNWINLAAFFFAAVWNVHRAKPHDIARWKKEKPKLYRRFIAERLAIFIFAGGLLALDWKSTVIYFGIPWLFGQWGIVTINLLQHQGCEHESAYNHSRNVTGRWINWLFLNNGFHTAHHLRPALHWSRLAEFHRNQIEPKMRGDLNQRSILAAIWQQFFAPRKQKELL